MKLEEQVVSLELAKELKENGYPQEEGLWWWVWDKKDYNRLEWEWKISAYNIPSFANMDEIRKENKNSFVAPTVAELGERLPDYFHSIRDKGCFPNKWIAEMIKEAGSVLMDRKFIDTVSKSANTEANARAKCWLYLKKEGLLGG